MAIQKGSSWSKWDLHIHTPFTKLNDGYKVNSDEDLWKSFCTKIESSDVDAFGITDYFSVDNYFQFLKKHTEYYPNSQKVFFPNIEFRLDVSVNKSAEEVNIHVIFSNSVDKGNIDLFLQKLNTNITKNSAKVPCKGLCTVAEYVSAGVDYVDIKEKLAEVFGKDNCYIIVAAANNAGLRPDTKSPRKLNITDEIDKVCDAFFGGQQNVEYYLDVDRYETDEKAKPKPVIGGSDAHSLEDVDNFLGKRFIKHDAANGKAEIVKDITWIKAEPTFNGLKQILYEPLHRVQIGEVAPRAPTRNLDKIQFNFPSKIQIKKKGSVSQDLCIGCITKEIYFRRYFTCLIGGRGTGKSTIINLISERLEQRTDFFSENQNGLFLQGSNIRYDIKSDPLNFIEVAGTNDVEFVSQGKIERLTEGQELTNLIFKERILEPDSELKTQKDKVYSLISIVEEQIDLIKQIDEANENISIKKKEANNYQNVIDSINDPIYLTVTKEIANLSSEKATMEASRNKYQTLLNRIHGILQETKINNKIKNLFEQRVEEIIEYIKKIDEFKVENGDITVSPKSFEEIEQRLEEVEVQLNDQQASLAKFFGEKGTSEESIKDSINANESVARLKEQIEVMTAEMLLGQERFIENTNKLKELKDLAVKTRFKIRNSIQYLNAKLETKNENVLKIRYEFEYNQELYKDVLFNNFRELFQTTYHKPSLSWDSIKQALFIVEPTEELLNLSHKDFVDSLDNSLIDKGFNKSTLYVSVLFDIFKSASNFQIYQLLIFKGIYNWFDFLSITGYYGKRPLQQSSFGQKCTAVIVTLLMTGVKPLIIDEPEAHLDNRLIADYLVDLIKGKKADRQIIFATHNANFVVNGDAELIHILEVPDEESFTTITSTTIENLTHRDKLLKLEGGKVAFEKREKKLLT